MFKLFKLFELLSFDDKDGEDEDTDPRGGNCDGGSCCFCCINGDDT